MPEFKEKCFYKSFALGLLIAFILVSFIMQIVNAMNINTIAAQLNIDTIEFEDVYK